MTTTIYADLAFVALSGLLDGALNTRPFFEILLPGALGVATVKYPG